MEENVYKFALGGDSIDMGFENVGPLELREDPPGSGEYQLTGRVRNTGDDVRESNIHITLIHLVGRSLNRLVSETTRLHLEPPPIEETEADETTGEWIWKSNTDLSITTYRQPLPHFDPSHREHTTCHIKRIGAKK